MSRALILNASYEPLCVVSTRRALLLVLDAKAELVHATDGKFRSERVAFPEPSVVRLAHYVKVPYQARIALNRRAVFARDGHRCQYCGASAETIDHVMPRSRGGPHAWDNVVAACARRNHSKGDRTPAEAGWRLPAMPAAPKGTAWRVLGHRTPAPRWSDWLELPEVA